MYSQQDVIKKFMKSLDNTTLNGEKALDEAVRACSSFSSIKDVINKMVSDCRNASSATDFLKNKCDIDLDNADTGAISGWDTGGSVIKTAESVVPENGAASYPSGNSFTVRGLKVNIPNKNTLTNDQQIVVQGLYSWWIEESLKLVEESYGLSFTESGTTVKEITLKFENAPYSSTLASVTPHFYVLGGKTVELDLTINMGRFNNLSSSDVNGKSYDTSLYLDRTLAHEFTHAVMAANINYFSYLHDFITEGAAELIHGVDDERDYLINYFAENPDKLAEYLRLDVNVMGDTGEYAAGYMFFRYLAKQGTLNPPTNTSITDSEEDTVDSGTSNTSVKSGTSGKDSFYNFDSNVEIKMYAGDDYISNYGTNVTIDGGAGDDKISNHAKDIYIESGSGNDTIFNSYTSSGTIVAGDGEDSIDNDGDEAFICGGAGDDYIDNGGDNAVIEGDSGNDYILSYSSNATINGGAGNDTIYLTSYSGKNNLIQYSSGDGNDIIQGIFDNDTIQISGSSYSTTVSDNDIIITVGTGKITVKGGANQNIKINGNETYVTPTVPSGVTPINIINNIDNTIISGTSGDDTIENNNNYVTINGGAGNDSIRNYYNENATISGDDGNDIIDNNCNNASISGGAGDDSIYNSGDNITINGNDGSDYIYNWLGSNVTISGGTGDDSIYNYYGTNNASISGGAGNDSINNYINDNVTVNAGAGDDTIILSDFSNSNVIQYANGDGNDIIEGFISNNMIEISGGSYTTQVSGNDVIINIGDGSMTLKNAYNQTLNIVTVSGGNNTSTNTISGGTSTDTETNTETTTTTLPSGLKYNSSKTVLTVSKKYTDDEIDLADYATTVKTLKATSVDKEFTIYGNDLDNKITVGKKATTVYGDDGNDNITGGKSNDVLYGEDGNDKLKGGNGADTLFGGEGKNTLTGGAGKDVFVYEDGNDIITDYKAGQDSIMIEDEIDSVTVKGKNVIFNIGDGAVTVKGGKSKNITIIDSDGEIISNDKYTKSTKIANFVEESGADSGYWFATDNNFANDNVDSIIEVEQSIIVDNKNLLIGQSTQIESPKIIQTYYNQIQKK